MLGSILIVGVLLGSQMNPVISSLDPASGPTGTTVTVRGKNFTPTTGVRGTVGAADDYGGNTVHFGPDVTITNINSADGLILKFDVPGNIAPGAYGVTIENSKGTSNSTNFTVTKDER